MFENLLVVVVLCLVPTTNSMNPSQREQNNKTVGRQVLTFYEHNV